MAIARRLDGLSAFTGADLKVVFSLKGVDLSGKSGTFHVSSAPQAGVLINAAVTILTVLPLDGVPTTVMQAFAAKSVVQAAKIGIAPADPGADITLYYEFRISSLGDVGTNAETTLLYGTFILKGSI